MYILLEKNAHYQRLSICRCRHCGCTKLHLMVTFSFVLHVIFRPQDITLVWQKRGKSFNPKNAILMVKYDDVIIMPRECLSACATSSLFKVNGSMKEEQYIQILDKKNSQSTKNICWNISELSNNIMTQKIIKVGQEIFHGQ